MIIIIIIACVICWIKCCITVRRISYLFCLVSLQSHLRPRCSRKMASCPILLPAALSRATDGVDTHRTHCIPCCITSRNCSHILFSPACREAERLIEEWKCSTLPGENRPKPRNLSKGIQVPYVRLEMTTRDCPPNMHSSKRLKKIHLKRQLSMH